MKLKSNNHTSGSNAPSPSLPVSEASESASAPETEVETRTSASSTTAEVRRSTSGSTKNVTPAKPDDDDDATDVSDNDGDDDTKPLFEEVKLEVECGSNKARLHLSRLCQGSKGPCIEFNGAWLTPNEFQYVSGRESAKDWKRSIRHHGKSMKLLLSKATVTIQPPSCECEYCTGTNVTATDGGSANGSEKSEPTSQEAEGGSEAEKGNSVDRKCPSEPKKTSSSSSSSSVSVLAAPAPSLGADVASLISTTTSGLEMDVATAAAAAAAAAPPADDAGMIDGCPGIPPLDMDSHSTQDDSTEFNNTATTPAAQTPRSCVNETQVTSRVDVNSHEIHTIDETSHENVTSPAPSNQSRDSFTAQPEPESTPLVEIKPQPEEPNTEDCEVQRSAVCEMETSIPPPPPPASSSSSSSLVMESDLPPVSRQSPKPIVVEPKPEVSDSPTMHLSGAGPLTPSPASQTSPSPSAPSLPPTAVAPPPPSVSSATLSQALPATVAAAVSTPPALIACTQLDQQAVKENGTTSSNHKMDVFIPSSRDGNPVRLDRYSPVKDAANTPNDLFNQKLDGFHSIKDAAYNSMKEAYKEAYSPRKDNNYSPRHDAFNSRKDTYSPHKDAGFPTTIKEGFPARKDTTPDNLTNKLIFPPVMDMGDASLKTAASILKEMLKNEEALKVAMSKTEIENAKTSSVETPVTSGAQQPILNEHRDSSENNNDSKSAGCNRCTENSTTSTSKLGLSSIAMTRTPDKISPPSLSRTPDKCNIPPSRTPDRVTTPVKMMPDRIAPSQQAKPSPDKFMPYLNAHTLYPQLTKLERERDLQRERDAMAQSLAHRAAAAAAAINDHKSVSPKMAAVKQGPLPPPPQPKDSIKPKTHSPHTSHADSRDLSRDLSHSKIYAPVTWPPVTVDSRKDEKSSARGSLSDAHKTHLTSSASSSSTVTSSGLSAVTSAGLPIMSTSASVMAAAAAASTSAAATAGQMHGKMDPTASYLEYLRAMSSAYPHLLSQPGMEGSEYLAYIRRYYEWYEYHKLYPYLVPPSPCGRMPPPGVDPRSSLAAADFSKQAGMCLTSPYSPYLYGMDPRMLATAAGASAFDVNKYMNSAARGKDATTTSSETSNGHVSPRTNERKRNTPEVEDEALDLTVKKQRISDPETKSKASENGLRKDTPLVSVDTSRLLPGTLPGTHPLGGMGLYPQFWDFSSLPPGSMPSMGIPGLPHASAAGMFSLPKDQNGALRMQLFPHLAPSCAGSAERDRMLSHLRL